MDIKTYLDKGRKRCLGCNMRGICAMKAAELEHMCPCFECVVLVMCNKGCDEYHRVARIANVVLFQGLKENAGDNSK